MSNINDKICNVKNRSASIVVYKIPEDGIRREFAPGETKRITYGELVKLTFQAGGREIMEQYLQITDDEVTDELNIHREPEYDMSESQVKDLVLNGSLEAFLDCLDFAPIGIIDLIKRLAVQLPMNDMAKAEALKNKTGFDLEAAIKNMKADQEPEDGPFTEVNGKTTSAKTSVSAGRRTTANYKANTTTSSTKPNYKVVEKK